MYIFKRDELSLKCFSPPVMMVTFFIEIILAIYVLWRYKLSSVTRVTSVLLFCLAFFQLAEFNVCKGAMLLDNAGWARLGYVAITLLPPLGIHLTRQISNDKSISLVAIAYGMAAIFITYFLFIAGGITAGKCMGNYVIFEHDPNTVNIYAAYYYGLLLAGIAYAYFRGRSARKNIRQSLMMLITGYVLFMIPTTLVNVIDPSTIYGIPSIMCGFAVILAVVLASGVLPKYFDKKKISIAAWRSAWKSCRSSAR